MFYLTFNGKECTSPATIDAVIYSNVANINLHRSGSLDGFCENIPKGKVAVGLSVIVRTHHILMMMLILGGIQ